MSLEYVEISSAYYRRSPSFDRERIADRRIVRTRNHKKRHGVNKESSHIARSKAAEAKKKKKAHLDQIRAFHSLVQAYWTGAADVHP